jgi:hypothetical protein
VNAVRRGEGFDFHTLQGNLVDVRQSVNRFLQYSLLPTSRYALSRIPYMCRGSIFHEAHVPLPRVLEQQMMSNGTGLARVRTGDDILSEAGAASQCGSLKSEDVRLCAKKRVRRTAQ